MYFLRVCVTVYCMHPCEAVCLLVASRLVFPKQAAGLWLRFVYGRVCVCVCVHLFDSDCVQGVHAKFSLAVVCLCTCLCDFVYESVCLPACPSVCLFPSVPVTYMTSCLSIYDMCFTIYCLCCSWSGVGLQVCQG